MNSRRLARSDVLVIGAAISLVILIGLVTYLAATLVSRTVADRFQAQELELVTALSRQVESLFDILGTEARSLAARPEIQSISYSRREAALSLLNDLASRRSGSLSGVVRLDADGELRYVWPPSTRAAFEGAAPPWTLTAARLGEIRAGGEVSFLPVPRRDQLAYLLVAPVEATSGKTEFLALELDLTTWLETNLGLLDLGNSGQLWLIDSYGRLLYQGANPAVTWAEATDLPIPFLLQGVGAQSVEYPGPDGPRQATFARTALGGGATATVILSRSVTEVWAGVQGQLAGLTALALAAVGLVPLMGVLVARRVAGEAGHRQLELQRRLLARALLDIARAINASLDLDEVLQQMLSGLGGVLDHDSVSVLLRTDDETLTMVAQAVGGEPRPITRAEFALDELPAAGEILHSGEPLYLPDCLADPRWRPTGENPIRSWLGVPLRVPDEIVGVLNINRARTGSFEQEDIAVAQAFADQAGVAITNARLHAAQIQAYETELHNAREIQTSLLPQEPYVLPQLEVVGRSLPARVVSGDYFQFLPRLDGRLGVAIGDVMGKGMPAALLMAVVSTAIRREFERQPTIEVLFDQLNASLSDQMRLRHTNSGLAMAIFDPLTRRTEVANAGMVQPYVRDDRGKWQLLPVGGYPLGASIQRRYTAKTVTLAPGALLVLTSDGVVEARNAAGEMFGFDRLEALLAGLPTEIVADEVVSRILAAVDAFLDGGEAQDDITVVVMRSLPGAVLHLGGEGVSAEATLPHPLALAQSGDREAARPAIEED